MEGIQLVKVDLNNQTHCSHMLKLLNDYMEDDMGIGQPLPNELEPKIVEGLKKHKAYLGFLVYVNNECAALANCNLNYSTWHAEYIINIHDFVVAPDFRERGIGKFLLDEVEKYARENGYSKINLEVRNDNIKAQNLYKKAGFEECAPPMYFWEKRIK